MPEVWHWHAMPGNDLLLYSDALLHSPGLVWWTSYTKPMGWSLQQGSTGTQYPGKGDADREMVLEFAPGHVDSSFGTQWHHFSHVPAEDAKSDTPEGDKLQQLFECLRYLEIKLT